MATTAPRGKGPLLGPAANARPGGPPRRAASSHRWTQPANEPLSPNGTSPTAMHRPLPPPQSLQSHDRLLFLLLGLIGARVTVTTTSGARFEGLLAGAHTKDELAVTLKHATALDEPDAPVRRALTIMGRDLADISAAGIDLDARTDVKAPVAAATASGTDTFRTDTDISGGAGAGGEGRTLQQWSGGPAPAADARASGSLEAGGKSGSWDQFATNERLYGVKTNFDEDLYTTKLDRSGKDYRDRERKANQLAQEILSSGAANAHVAEERNQVAAQELGDEEDRYGAVIRGPGAYVPPGARAAAAAAAAKRTVSGPPPADSTASSSPALPVPAIVTSSADGSAPRKVVNGAAHSQSTSVSPSAQATALPAASAEAPANAAAPASSALMGDFRSFVVSEKERLHAKKQAVMKKEKDSKLDELRSFSAGFKYAVPDDLLPILSKDEDKQKAIASRTSPSNGASPSGGVRLSSAALAQHNAVSGGAKPPRVTSPPSRKLEIAEIPPFDPNRHRAKLAAAVASNASVAGTEPNRALSPQPSAGPSRPPTVQPIASAAPLQPPAAATKINPAAPAFRPNPTAIAFTPGGAAAGPSTLPKRVSPAPAPAPPEPPKNPFFGSRAVRKNSNVAMQVKEDFSPFLRERKVPEARTIPPMWSYTGKPYRLFNAGPATGGFDTAAPVSDAESQAAAQAHAQAQAVALMQAAGVVPGMLAYPHPTAMQPAPSSSTSSSQQQHPPQLSGSQPGVDPSGMRSPPPPQQPAGFMPMPYGAPQFRYAQPHFVQPGQPMPFPPQQHFMPYALPPGAIPAQMQQMYAMPQYLPPHMVASMQPPPQGQPMRHGTPQQQQQPQFTANTPPQYHRRGSGPSPSPAGMQQMTPMPSGPYADG